MARTGPVTTKHLPATSTVSAVTARYFQSRRLEARELLPYGNADKGSPNNLLSSRDSFPDSCTVKLHFQLSKKRHGESVSAFIGHFTRRNTHQELHRQL